MEMDNSINVVRDVEVRSRIESLQRLVASIEYAAKEPYTMDENKSLASLCDQGIVHVLEIFKDFYRRSGYLDDGLVKEMPVRDFAFGIFKEWQSVMQKPGLDLVVDRFSDTLRVMRTMIDKNVSKPKRVGARKSLQSRGLM